MISRAIARLDTSPSSRSSAAGPLAFSARNTARQVGWAVSFVTTLNAKEGPVGSMWGGLRG
jgi:hypothetical protein